MLKNRMSVRVNFPYNIQNSIVLYQTKNINGFQIIGLLA